MANHDSLAITLRDVCWDADRPDGGTQRILHTLSTTLTEQRIAVIGANGSGKSTLLRLIAGLTLPTVGSVEFSVPEIRTGFIFANPQAQLVMPVVIEDVEFSLRSRIRHRSERRAAAEKALAEIGLAHRAESSVYDLSSGEQQKVALAGVLATGPDLVLADEPTTLLDLRASADFQHRLMHLDAPLIVATHDLEFAAQADRALVFDSGCVVFDGPAPDAVAAYRSLALG